MPAKSNTKLIMKIIEVLDKLGISQHDCILAEKYLSAEVGDEILDEFERMGFVEPVFQVNYELYEINKQVEKIRKRAVCVRFFNIIYAIGHGSCYHLDSYGLYDDVEECALYKRLIVFLTKQIERSAYWDHNVYDLLMDRAQYNIRNLIEVVPFLKAESEFYGAVVLAIYFCEKYENAGGVAAEDTALITEYENIVLGGFDAWLAKQGITEHREVVMTLREQKTAEGLLHRIEFTNINEEDKKQFSFICSLAYLNFQLSDGMLALVQGCVVVNQEMVLRVLDGVYIGARGCRTNMAVHGGDYDEVFHIDPALYICWAAYKKYNQILMRQLEKHQKIYLQMMNRDECQRQLSICRRAWGYVTDSYITEYVLDTLKDVLLEVNPSLYQQQVRNLMPNYEFIIGLLVSPTPHAELAKEYLRGNCKVSELYPYSEEFDDGCANRALEMYSFRIKKFRQHCGDEAFINRCRVFLILKKFRRLDHEIEDCSLLKNDANIKRFFENLAKEQLDAAHQLQAFSFLYNESDDDDSKIDRLIHCGEKVFSKFLEENREETLKVFSEAYEQGRSLGVHILGKAPQTYKKEILSYVNDTAPLVMNEVYHILCERKDWEADVMTLLKAKKVSVRELAMRVLLEWKEEDEKYSQLLYQMLQKEKSARLVRLLESGLKRNNNCQIFW